MPRYDVVSCGSATLDVFAQTDNEVISIDTPHSHKTLIAYPVGSKMLIKELLVEVGGGGTNTAYGFSLMGLSTGYVGCLGDDESAQRILGLLASKKISFLGHKSKKQTGYSVILDSVAHDRTILTYKGANDDLSFSKVDARCWSARWLYCSSMMGRSFETQKRIIKKAAAGGCSIAYNPSEYQVSLGKEMLMPVLRYTTLLVFNKEEAGILTGKDSLVAMITTLLSWGISSVCITDGSKAAYYACGSELYELIPRNIKVVESTGAGDAFACGLVCGLAKGDSIEQSLRIAQANAESVISYHGAKNKLLSYTQAKRFSQRAKVRITKQKM